MGIAPLRNRVLLNGVLCGLLLCTVAIGASAYVAGERYFYFWDYVGYQVWTVDQALSFQQSVFEALAEIRDSLATDYNRLYTLPLIPFILALGESRLAYVLGLALVYLVPLTLVLGLLAIRVLAAPRMVAMWLTVALALLTPAVWVPIVRGYPDAGGAALIGLALWVCLVDLDLKRGWQPPLLGFLIAAAILFRRHFAYGGVALVATLALYTAATQLGQVCREPGRAIKGLARSGLKIALAVVVSLATLAAVGWPFFQRILTIDYSALYASYARSVAENLRYFGTYYGAIAWVLAGAGLTLGIRSGALRRGHTGFVGLFGLLSLTQWVLQVRQTGPHYALRWAPVIILGLAGCAWMAWRFHSRLKRLLAASLLGAYLVGNALVGLTNLSTPAGWLLAARHGPPVRTDYDEIVRLVDYLRNMTTAHEPIYVVDSSVILNHDIVAQAERALYGREQTKLNLVLPPQIDSRDTYPLEKLLQAKYVVVTVPFQHHLAAAEQDVVRVVYDAFTQNWEIARDFSELPQHFSLTDGARTRIYQRTRSTSLDKAVRTLYAMQQVIGTRPGSQPDWLALQEQPLDLRCNPGSSCTVRWSDGSLPRTTHLLYLGDIPERGKVEGTLIGVPGCSYVGHLQLVAISADGKPGDAIASAAGRLEDVSSFALAFHRDEASYLLLSVSIASVTAPSEGCVLSIERLTVVNDHD